MAKDPVCGMQVDEQMAVATSVYQGQTYYFCAKACQTAFDREPGKFLGSTGEAPARPRMIQAEASREAGPGGLRRIVVGVAAVVGLVLMVLGIFGLRALMAVGTVAEPPGLRLVYTTASLAVGLWLIVWLLVAGLSWAGLRGRK